MLREIAHLAPHVVLGHERAARIGTEPHRNARIEGIAGALDDALEHHVGVELGEFVHERHARIEFAQGDGRRDRADVGRPRLLVQLDDLGRCGSSMLDGIDSPAERHPYAFGAFGMARHVEAELMGLIAYCRRLLKTHFELPRLAFYLGIHHAARHAYLDEIDAMLLMAAYECPQIVRLGCRKRKRAVPMSAGNRDGRARYEQTRTPHRPCVDAVTQTHVGPMEISHCTHRGYARSKLRLGSRFHHRIEHLRTERSFGDFDERLRTAAARKRLARLARAEQVHMQVDQARNGVLARTIDALEAVPPRHDR